MARTVGVKEFFFCFRRTHKDAFLPEIGLQTDTLNLSAGVDLKSLHNYEIAPNGGRCEVRTGVALEFVTSDKHKIETLKRLNTAAEEHRGLPRTPLSPTLSPPKGEAASSPSSAAKRKRVGFKEPEVEDLIVLSVKDERGVVMVRSRSGLAWKDKINVVSVYFSLERDEIVVGVVNYGSRAFVLKSGERFAQLIVHSNEAEGYVDRVGCKGPKMDVADFNGLCGMPVFKNTEEVKIPPGGSRLVKTENVIAMEGSEGVYMQLENPPNLSRDLMYTDIHAGVIDADYRGKVGVVIHNDGDDEIVIPIAHTVATGMIYKVCCPIGQICEVLCPVSLDRDEKRIDASEVFYTLGDRMGMLEAGDVTCGEGEMEYLLRKKSEEEPKMETGKRYTIRTGICLRTEKLKRMGLVAHFRAPADDVLVYKTGVRGWEIDKNTGEIILLMKGGDGRVYMKDDVLAEVLLLKRGTRSAEGPRIIVSGDERGAEGGNTRGRGDKGFGSTGM